MSERAKRIPGDRFGRAVERMEMLMKKLLDCDPLSRDELADIPEEGIYVFCEGGKPLYVGRSRSLRTRILNHGRNSSSHFKATFAFLIGMEEAKRLGIKPPLREDGKKPTKGDWERHSGFSELFTTAKQRVASMKVQVVEVPDPIEQTLFEVYAAVQFNTTKRYNSFETH